MLTTTLFTAGLMLAQGSVIVQHTTTLRVQSVDSHVKWTPTLPHRVELPVGAKSVTVEVDTDGKCNVVWTTVYLDGRGVTGEFQLPCRVSNYLGRRLCQENSGWPLPALMPESAFDEIRAKLPKLGVGIGETPRRGEWIW